MNMVARALTIRIESHQSIMHSMSNLAQTWDETVFIEGCVGTRRTVSVKSVYQRGI